MLTVELTPVLKPFNKQPLTLNNVVCPYPTMDSCGITMHVSSFVATGKDLTLDIEKRNQANTSSFYSMLKLTLSRHVIWNKLTELVLTTKKMAMNIWKKSCDYTWQTTGVKICLLLSVHRSLTDGQLLHSSALPTVCNC